MADPDRPRPSPRPATTTGDRPDGVADRASTGRRWWWRPAVGVLVPALVVAVLVVANVVLAVRRDGAEAREQARTAAVTAARTRVPALLGYDWTALDAHATRAGTLTTGAFRTRYATLFRTRIRPAALTQHTRTRAGVKTVGVVSADRDRVVLLMLLDQTTTSTAATRIDGSRSLVTMRDVHGTWLVAGLTPV